ncbi:hypothetical protein P7K49_035585, partial [Saguinus oedipus]
MAGRHPRLGPKAAAPAAIYLHRVSKVKLLRSAAELLPGLVLRHRGLEWKSKQKQGRRTRPSKLPMSRESPTDAKVPAAPRWRRLLAPTPRSIGQPRPRRPNGQEGCCQGVGGAQGMWLGSTAREVERRATNAGCHSAPCRAEGAAYVPRPS